MLIVRSVDEIVYKDVPEGERFNLMPDVTNGLYLYRRMPFHYALCEHMPQDVSGLESFDFGRHYAQFGKAVTRLFSKKDHRRVKFEYFDVEVWRQIDEEFRDVFLAHELFEMRHHVLDKMLEKEAHANAFRETDEYIKRYLSREDQSRFKVMLDSLNKKRAEPSKMKVFRIN